MLRGGLRASTLRRPLEYTLVAAALVLLFLALHFVVTHPVGRLDFANFYTAGTILRESMGNRLYDLSLQANIQRPLAQAGPFLPFYHPPFEALLFLPFAYLSFPLAFLVWDGLNLALLGVIFYLLPRVASSLDNDNSLVWLAFSFPFVAGALVLGQDTLVLALIFLLAYRAMRRRREFAAGIALGLGLFRFEILLPFVFVFLLRGRWKVLTGFSVGAAVAVYSSVMVVGWRGLYKYARVLIQVAQDSGKWSSGLDVATMPSLRGALVAFSNGAIPAGWIFLLSLIGAFLLLGWAAWEFRSIAQPEDPSFDIQFSFAVIASLLASYHLFAHELTPLIVVAFLLLGYERATRRGRKLLDRPCATLLLLSSVTMAVSEILEFRNLSVLFVVLFGLMLWLSREMAEPQLQ